MGIIPDQDREFLIDKFGDEMKGVVTIQTFTKHDDIAQPGLECNFCEEVEELMEELGELSDKIRVEINEYTPDSDLVRDLGIDKLPAVIIETPGVYSVRYFGLPSGFEFSSLVSDIVDVSRGGTELPADLKKMIRGIDHDVHIQVFMTPTCPYCPSVVRIAHQMAIENPEHIRADAIEASEFPHLVEKYRIDAVPTVVVNEKVQFEGALPDKDFAEKVMRAA